MAHFAQLDGNNSVLQVIVVHNDETHDASGIESEAKGIQFCQSLFGADTRWIQTSYNGTIRKNYAGIGYQYDAARDAFISPQPHLSWSLNAATCVWEAPIPYPTDGGDYYWDEATLSWLVV